jgi:hypothetical protein
MKRPVVLGTSGKTCGCFQVDGLYSRRDELGCFRSQSSSPKRQRERALPPSLTLRITFNTIREQYRWKEIRAWRPTPL